MTNGRAGKKSRKLSKKARSYTNPFDGTFQKAGDKIQKRLASDAKSVSF